MEHQINGSARLRGVARLFAFVAFACLTWATSFPVDAQTVPIGARQDVDSSFAGAICVRGADIDKNGTMDVLASSFDGNEIAWWRNLSGDGTIWLKNTIATDFPGAVAADAGDMDGDGDIDVVGAAYDGGYFVWWENMNGLGTDWTGHLIDNSLTSPRDVRITSIGGSGAVHVLGVDRSLGAVILYRFNGPAANPQFTKTVIDGSYGSPLTVSAADLDGDGLLDPLAPSLTSNQIAWWKERAATPGVWDRIVVSGGFPEASSARGAPINDLDPRIHVFGAAQLHGEVAWWRNDNGDGVTWTKTTIGTHTGASDVSPADVDGDGDTDVLVAGFYGGGVAWFENTDRVGGTWTRRGVQADFGGAASVHAIDIDRDLDPDFIGAAYTDGRVSWWRNGAWPTATTMTPEPVFTPGLDNAVTWDRAALTRWHHVQCDDSAGFNSPHAEIDADLTETAHTFTGLTDLITYNYRVRAKDVWGRVSDWSPVVFSTQDASGPEGSFAIADGAHRTRTNAVTLNMDVLDLVSGMNQMRFSNDGVVWSPWEPYAALVPVWNLTHGPDGSRTVHGEFTDLAGNFTAMSDSILYDVTTPEFHSFVATPTVGRTGAGIAITFKSSEPLSADPVVTVNGNAASVSAVSVEAAGDTDHTAQYTIRASDSDGDATISVTGVDQAGNSGTTVNTTALDVDQTPPTGSIVINGGAPYTNSQNVTLTLSATDTGPGASGVASMRFSNDSVSWSAWTVYATLAPWTIPGGDSVKTVRVQFGDAAGNVSTGVISDDITLDQTQPTGDFVINREALFTRFLDVAVSPAATDPGPTASGVVDARFRNNGQSWSEWVPYSGFIAWRLTAGDDIKFVEGQFRDGADNLSDISDDEIILDQTPPMSRVVAPDGVASTWSLVVEWEELDPGVLASGVIETEVFWNKDGGPSRSMGVFEAGTLEAPFDANALGGDRTYGFFSRARDVAGNVEAPPSGLDETVLVRTRRFSSSELIDYLLGILPLSHAKLEVADANRDGLIDIADLYFWPDRTPAPVMLPEPRWSPGLGNEVEWTPVDVAKTYVVQVDDAPDFMTPLNEAEVSSPSVTHTFTGLFDDARFWFRARAVDAFFYPGDWSAPTSSIQDAASPQGTILINGGAEFTNGSTVSLELTATDPGTSPSGVFEMRFSNDGSTWGAWEPVGPMSVWALSPGDGPKTVHAQYRDGVLNESTGPITDEITRDTQPPFFDVFVVAPPQAMEGALVEISFDASEPLLGNPTVAVNGHPAAYQSENGLTYTYSYIVLASDPDGPATIDVSGTDRANNVGASANTTALTVDRTRPSGTIIIDEGAPYTSDTLVRLDLTASDSGPGATGVANMRFSSDGATWTVWEPFATVRMWSLEGLDDIKQVHVQYQDAVGNISLGVFDDINFDRTAPTGFLLINDNAPFTSSTLVRLTLSCSDPGATGSGILDMQFSNDGFLWTAWEPYGTERLWFLDPGEGFKRTLVRVRDRAGNHAVDPFGDTITYDATPPSGSVTIDDGRSVTSSTVVVLTVSAVDGGFLPSGMAEMRFSNDGVNWSPWQPYAMNAPWALTPGDGPKLVHVQFSDMADNIGAGASDTIDLDLTPPHGTIVINDGDARTSSTEVRLTLVASDPGPGASGVTRMSLRNAGEPWGAWEPYVPERVWILPAGDGPKDVEALFGDGAGHVSLPAVDSITLDGTGPTGSIVINDDEPVTTSSLVTLTLAASDPPALGSLEMSFRNEAEAWSPWEPFAPQWPWTLSAGDGPKLVEARFRDDLRNESAVVGDDIFLDTSGPVGSVLINDDAPYTMLTDVTLSLDAVESASFEGIVVPMMEMSLRNATDPKWGAWEPYQPRVGWVLPGGDGLKEAQARFRDVLGNVSDATSDVILLDTTSPESRVTTATKEPGPPNQRTLHWDVVDPGATPSGPQWVEVFWCRDQPIGPYQQLGVYPFGQFSADFNADDHGGEGLFFFFSVAVDNAGNKESPPVLPDLELVIGTAVPPVSS